MEPVRSIQPSSLRSWSELTLGDLREQMAALGLPTYRADQLHSAIHRRGVGSWDEITELSSALRGRLADMLPLRSLELSVDLTSPVDHTNKALLLTADGGHVESVLMRSMKGSRFRHTVCVSSQIGCPAACAFCASGASFMRNLTVPEIVDQVEMFAGRLRAAGGGLDNVVYMGMGEPFLNYGRVMESIRRLQDPLGLGLGARRITVSTVGIVPAIRRFARHAGEVNLAVSLHAPEDDLRSHLVPYNRRYAIDQILAAVSEYIRLTNRRVSFEYVLLRGVNDDLDMAARLAARLSRLAPLAHVNLIPWNPTADAAGFDRTSRVSARRFSGRVRAAGINATIRYSKGLDIDAACGQLRNRLQAQALAS